MSGSCKPLNLVKNSSRHAVVHRFHCGLGGPDIAAMGAALTVECCGLGGPDIAAMGAALTVEWNPPAKKFVANLSNSLNSFIANIFTTSTTKYSKLYYIFYLK